jgi:hypothetical protein
LRWLGSDHGYGCVGIWNWGIRIPEQLIWISYTLQTNCKREILSGPTSKSPHARLFCNLILRLHLTDDRLREIDILLKLGYIPFAMHCLAFAETHSI